MKFRELLENWSSEMRPVRTAREYAVRLPLDDAARLHALTELFPGHSAEELITDLLGVALDELETAMPYKPGSKEISQDEQGDPVYEDVGLTPQFLRLARRFKQELAGEARRGDAASE